MPEREHNRDHSTGQAGEKLPRWVAQLPSGVEVEVSARTKSEARAMLKIRLGMVPPMRLPVGITLLRGTE